MTRDPPGNVIGIVVTILIFLAVACVSVWQVSSGLSTNFNIMGLSPDQSFLRDFYNMDRGLKGWCFALT
jgi:hypothetical protein